MSSRPRLAEPLAEVEPGAVWLVGGKGANLARMVRAGLPVPDGFCVTTAAYALATAGEGFVRLLDELQGIQPGESERLIALAARLRHAVLAAPMPAAVEAAVRHACAVLSPVDGQLVVAVRSSATAEDLGEASFAGQQDTYLNVVGESAVLDAVHRCWASLWSDRAVAYRAINRVDQRQVQLSAIVQRMVPAVVSGVLFTANPITGRRPEAVIDAAPGLGEALVSGRVNPDHFVVDRTEGSIKERRVGEKQAAAHAVPGGGTELIDTPGGAPACIDDGEVLDVVRLGARVEAEFGPPQDVEWALDEDRRLWLLQARPITTLFPVPESSPSAGLRVYVNLSNAQGVLQPLTPMGVEMFRRVGTGIAALLGFEVDPERGPAPLAVPAGRLFFDVTELLRAASGRKVLLGVLAGMEPRSADSIRELLGDPRMGLANAARHRPPVRRALGLMKRTHAPTRVLGALLMPERARRRGFAEVEGFLASAASPAPEPDEALDRVGRLAQDIPRRVVTRVLPPALAGVLSLVLARRLSRRSGVREDAMAITRGLPHNVTTEMDLELWEITRRLRTAGFGRLLEESPPSELAASYLAGQLPDEVQGQVRQFLQVYGFRGVAEIDVGVPRWEDDPTHVFGALTNLVRIRDPGLSPDVQFRRAGEAAGEAMRQAMQQARHSGFGGVPRAVLLRYLFRRVRVLGGLRESPKFYAVAALGICRKLLLSVGRELAEAGRIEKPDDVFFLTLAETREALSGKDRRHLVVARRAEYERESRRRRQPRVLLSDGSAFYGERPTTVGGDARTLTGSVASPGVYTGPARVVLDPVGARLEPGEVLVAPSTDPGWTPLFMTAGALVMEMGGMMSHGSIVAREYGIPAVVGVPGATASIRSGQVVTVDGERGLVRLAGDVVP